MLILKFQEKNNYFKNDFQLIPYIIWSTLLNKFKIWVFLKYILIQKLLYKILNNLTKLWFQFNFLLSINFQELIMSHIIIHLKWKKIFIVIKVIIIKLLGIFFLEMII